MTLEELKQLSIGLEYVFVDKNKTTKKFLAANFETIADKITDNLQSDQRENFDEFLRAYVDILTKNLHTTTDYTYKNLKRIINDKNLVVVSGDKAVVLIDKKGYQDKLQKMVDDGIKNSIYKVAEDSALKDLKLFKNFLYRNFKNYEHYDEMLPKSKQQRQLYGTAKIHKFTNIDEITIDSLNFHPIITQTRTYPDNVAQVRAEYLKPLCNGNNYIIRNTHEFSMSLKQQDPLLLDEEYVSCDVESLFTNVPVMKLLIIFYTKSMSKKNC